MVISIYVIEIKLNLWHFLCFPELLHMKMIFMYNGDLHQKSTSISHDDWIRIIMMFSTQVRSRKPNMGLGLLFINKLSFTVRFTHHTVVLIFSFSEPFLNLRSFDEKCIINYGTGLGHF